MEPTEMTILHNNDIIIAQRRGEILYYNSQKGQLNLAGKLDVYYKTDIPGVNAEEGLMGLQKDPNYATNLYVYLFYAPANKDVNRLSRFIIDADSIHMNTEKIVLEFYSQRDICCHTGGSIAFSPDGKFLYLSTGDNSTPFDQDTEYINAGYSPQDNRENYEQYDARRTSANTNDLRGKILRITLDNNGEYTIPEGNLFPENTAESRPEIYVMGTRNPYRISIDKKTGALYWGEVGPDAASDLESRGPMGYDEINKATEAGNYGWPFFVADNKAYKAYDYENGKSGDLYDFSKPINNSKNNTGRTTLPPSRPAMIYYPYDESQEFPQLASGGRNAMAGPVYYGDLYPEEHRYPSFYDGKLFIYDWIRQWIKTVEMKDSSITIEGFMPDENFASIIDMEQGPDGRIYILEYGKGWFSKNEDAGLSRFDYNYGNRAPRIQDIRFDKKSGAVPLSIKAEVTAYDPDNDDMTYQWYLDGKDIEYNQAYAQIQISEIGEYVVYCDISDEAGRTTRTEKIIINAGNDLAQIDIELQGNTTFFFNGEKIDYEIIVKDDQEFDINNLIVDHKIEGATSNIGHLSSVSLNIGEALVNNSDCASCHNQEKESVGPSYESIAERYKEISYAVAYLGEKIRLGGSGNWGEGAMAAHPTITDIESKQIAEWILKIKDSDIISSLPQKGSITPEIDPKMSWKNTSYLRASYSDKPTNGAKPLTSFQVLELRPNTYEPQFLEFEGSLNLTSEEGNKYLRIDGSRAIVKFEHIDLTDITKIEIETSNSQGCTFNVLFQDDRNQQIIANSELQKTSEKLILQELTILDDYSKISNYSLIFTTESTCEEPIMIGNISFEK